MKRVSKLRTSQKILIAALVGVLVVAAVFFGTQRGGGSDTLSEAIVGGELALTSVSRNYESLTQFLQEDEAQARQLLEAARATLENANVKLTSVRQSSGEHDEYVLGMLDNYDRVAQASDVMAQGVDNLLLVNANLTKAIDFYSENEFENASEQANYCLQVLTPLLSDFNASGSSLNGINVLYIPSGQRDSLTHGVSQYRSEMEVYNQIVLLLQSLMVGKDYLRINAQLEEYMRELQNAIANEDYETAQSLIQKISEALQSLKNPEYQIAPDIASQLDPDILNGTPSMISEELKNRLRDLEGLEGFENYLKSLQKYLEASELFKQGQLPQAEQAVNEGLGILSQSEGSDPELQGLYEGLRDAFNTLELKIKGQPDQG